MDNDVQLNTQSYKDLYLRIGLSLLAAHFIIAFGIKYSFWELLLMSAYYRSLLGSFIIAFILVSTIRWITIKLDRNWPWGKNNLVRLVYQLGFGVALIAAFAFILAAIYFKLHGINILKTGYLKFDFPIIVIFIVLVNTYYFAYYQYLLNKIVSGPATAVENGVTYKTQFIVTEGQERIPVKTENICYFYRDGNYNWLRLFEGTVYLYEPPLDETELSLDPKHFFRANRQMIVNYNACRSYHLLEYGKLELLLDPSPNATVIISQKRAADFKRWMDKQL